MERRTLFSKQTGCSEETQAATVSSFSEVRNLGVTIDPTLSFASCIKNVTKTAFFHLKYISKHLHSLSFSNTYSCFYYNKVYTTVMLFCLETKQVTACPKFCRLNQYRIEGTYYTCFSFIPLTSCTISQAIQHLQIFT